MYGSTGKMGRGGGGGGKRNIHAPPINRAAPTGRLSMGGGPRGRSAVISSPSTSSRQVEESFSLVRENPLNFGMSIKLPPDLVEEIKRVEAQGGTARIKFDANATNDNGNVIHVGDKSFKFTWSREPGDLCDIYEERQSGEDGTGLLVESGGTWRKLNMARELDESTTNHVKMRTEEAERKLKSRKAIVLDHPNPAMKNQMKAFAASESNQWRNFKNRKEPPFKKLKSEPTSVSAGGPSKPAFKSGLLTTTLSKGKLSSGSPLSSQPEQHGAPTSPLVTGDLVKGFVGVPEVAATRNMNKVSSSDKEITNRKSGSIITEKSKNTHKMEAKPADLRSLMVSLLQEHQSNGMSLKGLEKAIGDVMPNSARKIEPILKQIANFQAPGRYFLKQGVEMESLKKLSQSGSSPEINLDQSPAPQKFDQLPAQDHSIPMTTAANDEDQAELNPTPVHTSDIEKIDILQNSPENLGDKKVSNNSGGMAGSSSDSGSDSDSESDSSDSGSDSDSPSKSKSPVGSQSGSSSDSETDASSSSKQASDEDVDIMTSDDDKEPKHKLQESDAISSRNPVPWSNLEDEPVDIGNYEMQDPHASEVIEIEKDSPEDNHEAERPAANYSSANNEGEECVEEMKPSSADRNEQQERLVFERKTYDDEPNRVVNDISKHGQSGNHERLSKSKSKRRSDDKHSHGRTHNRKKSKSKSSYHQVSGAISSIFGESPCNSSPDRPLEGPDKGSVDLMENRTSRDYTNDPDQQTGSEHAISTRPVSDSQQPGRRSSEAHAWTGEKRPGKHKGVDHGVKHSERSFQAVEGLQMKKGINVEAQNEGGLVNEKRPLKSSTEGDGDKHGPVINSHNKKPEMMGKVKEAGSHSNSYRVHSPKDNNTSSTGRSPLMNGRSGLLRREHSDLELGEFREPSLEETPGSRKQFEKKNSFKHLDNKPMDSEYWNSDLSRVKTSNKIPSDSGKLTPQNPELVSSSLLDGTNKRKAQDNNIDDLTRPHNRSTRPLDAHYQSWGDHIDGGSQQNTVPETSGKIRFAEAGMGRGPSLEAYGDSSRKMPVNSTEHQHDPTRGVGVGPRSTKEIKKQKPKMVGVSNDRQLDDLTGINDGGQKNKVSSDENISSYTKYEKKDPELKGPVKDISQYKEYVKEYQEKYESYCSLKKLLESYSDEFDKLGKDLEAYRGTDMKRYHDILEQMRSSFRQCGERHKRLKKIFVVLYEELKCLKQMIKDFAASYKKD